MPFAKKLLSVLLLVTVSTALAGVSVDHNNDVDLSSYRTYAWEEGTPAKHPEAQKWIVSAVDRELRAKGLRQADSAADVYVSTHSIVDKHTLEQLADSSYWEFWTGVKSFDALDLRAGTLVVDLTDATLREVVWRGVGTANVSGPLDRNEKKIDKVVRKMFRRFPP